MTRAPRARARRRDRRVVQTVGLGPHRENRRTRDRPGSSTSDATAASSPTSPRTRSTSSCIFTGVDRRRDHRSRARRNVAHPGRPGFRGLRRDGARSRRKARGYIRVDWFTPDGLPTWGDGRLFILGTEGTIELRKYVDIAGRPGKDHLFLVDGKGTRHIDCSDAGLPYYAQPAPRHRRPHRDRDDRRRTAYKVCELALTAQAQAERRDAAA